ncbi:MAG: hypothetical protein EA357_05565 [Micavibrio sp.]|nr:MAG: hypothetical protein EA357_05565 [Micavibrio sp.]
MTRPTRYRIKNIREALVNEMTAIHYGSRVRAEAAMKSVELTSRRMSYEEAKNDNSGVFWQGLSECVWLMQNISRRGGEHWEITLSKPVGQLLGFNGDMTALAKELKPAYESVSKTMDYAKTRAKQREQDMQHERKRANQRNLRAFIRRR